MEQDLLDRFADLIVTAGANVQPGQVVAVEAEPESAPLARAVAARAYDAGARFVDVWYFDPVVKRIRLQRAAEETLEWVPRWYGGWFRDLGDLGAARIGLTPVVPPGSMDGVDPARAGRDQLPMVPERMQILAEQSTNWTLSPSPTRTWAERVYPDDADALERLWRDVAFVCRLDEADPAQAWRDRLGALHEVARRIDALELDALHFAGPGTDLTVGMLPSSTFAGPGPGLVTRSGIRHFPNIPSEEIYATPDPARADGIVRATKPINVSGALVTGLRVRFEGGRAVEIDADENPEVLRGRAATDDGASRLGEVALVDAEGRVGATGRTFYNTLLDENAASHLALGSAYTTGVADERDVERINRSAIHIDFMIGSDEVEVTGLLGSGERVPLLRGGRWQV